MIKPVYFSKKEEQLLQFASSLDNFSEWVKDKIKIELKVNSIGIVQMQQADIESLVRRIVQEYRLDTNPTSPILKNELQTLDIEKQPQTLKEEEIIIDGWTL